MPAVSGTVHWDGRASPPLTALLDNGAGRAGRRDGPSDLPPRAVDVAVIDEGEDPPDVGPAVRAHGRAPARRAGLGLSIARKRAEAHGGVLTLETGPGGTTACLRLPREAPTG